MKKQFTPEEFELWVMNKNAQYRIMNQEVTDDVSLTFWIPNEPIKKYKMSYENLIKIFDEADTDLYTIVF